MNYLKFFGYLSELIRFIQLGTTFYRYNKDFGYNDLNFMN
jgi:hypothetical protein